MIVVALLRWVLSQVWGGLGMTWECMAHVFLRRALLDADTLGGAGAQLAAIAAARLGPLQGTGG